jgi:hypothetical protein
MKKYKNMVAEQTIVNSGDIEKIEHISVEKQKKAVDACANLIDFYNKLSTATKQSNANFSVIYNAWKNNIPEQYQLDFADGTTTEQKDELASYIKDGLASKGTSGDPKNITDLFILTNILISSYTKLQDELKQQLSLENIINPTGITTKTSTTGTKGATTTTATTATTQQSQVAPSKPNYSMYYVLGGVVILGIITLTMLKK